MKARSIACAAAALGSLYAGPAGAEAGPFGAGLVVGSPLGIALKYYVGPGAAVDFVVGDALAGARGLAVHGDYLVHPRVLMRQRSFDMPVYIGIGARLVDHDRDRLDGDDDFHIGARVPAGLLFDFNEIPLDVFAEVALVLDFRAGDEHGHRGFGLDLNVGAGARYYF